MQSFNLPIIIVNYFWIRPHYFVIVFAVTMMFLGCCIKIAKWKRLSGLTNSDRNILNTTKYNQDLVALGRSFLLGTFVISVMAFRAILLGNIDADDGEEEGEIRELVSMLFYNLLHPTVAIVFAPMTIIIFNPGIKNFLKRLFRSFLS